MNEEIERKCRELAEKLAANKQADDAKIVESIVTGEVCSPPKDPGLSTVSIKWHDIPKADMDEAYEKMAQYFPTPKNDHATVTMQVESTQNMEASVMEEIKEAMLREIYEDLKKMVKKMASIFDAGQPK